MAVDQNLIDQLRAMLDNTGNPMRGNFYLAVARAYSAAGTDAAREAAHQALMQGQISTYSGQFGAAAILGNYAAKTNDPTHYLVTLDAFSTYIATRTLDAMEYELQHGGDGILTAPEMRALDYSVWNELGLGAQFPGNAQRFWDYDDGSNPLATSSVVFQEGMYDMHQFGTNAGFTLNYEDRDDNLWSPSSLMPFGDHAEVGMSVAAYHEILGKKPAMYGLSSADIIANGPRTSADGRYIGTVETMIVRDFNYRNQTKTVVTIRDVATGEVVVIDDRSVDLFESRENRALIGFKRALAKISSAMQLTGVTTAARWNPPSSSTARPSSASSCWNASTTRSRTSWARTWTPARIAAAAPRAHAGRSDPLAVLRAGHADRPARRYPAADRATARRRHGAMFFGARGGRVRPHQRRSQ